MSSLSNYIKVHRRYFRSVNLERDLEIPDSVLGYVLTSRSADTIERFLNSLTIPRSVRSYTITGVYGTGKSAFAHFLSALCSPENEPIRKNAISIIKKSDESLYHKILKSNLPKRGLVRAIVTAQREPIINTIIRALCRGTSLYWSETRGAKPQFLKELYSLLERVSKGKTVEARILLDIIQKIAAASGSGILIVIDELGKNLEFASQSQGSDDLYILQQIAELPSQKEDSKVFLFGLLHQSFADYAHGLTSGQRSEWAKIQGRFEDIPFSESTEQMIRLIASSINSSKASPILSSINKWGEGWFQVLKQNEVFRHLDSDLIASIFPLHPISAVALPTLCGRYAQNDRSLFTFLTSAESNSFHRFLKDSVADNNNLPTLKISKLYDYFVETTGISMSLRPQFQRWIEIQGRISDAKHLDIEALEVLKTIGILNLISNSGSLRATKQLVTLALCDNPNNQKECSLWNDVINTLVGKGFLVWRKQVDELRIWEGSDFNVEEETSEQIESVKGSLSELLNEYCPLRPVVAQRHSYQTGTLRYFEKRYIDNLSNLTVKQEYDGLICYWTGEKNELIDVPAQADGKPVIIICGTDLKAVRLACFEFVALKNIENNSPQLRSDGIARREVRQRLIYTKQLLDDAVAHSFDVSVKNVTCLINGIRGHCYSSTSFNSHLSDLFDKIYNKGPRLWNELINRRELTTQASKARRILIEAMLVNTGKERLGLLGNGPEISIYESLLAGTGIYTKESSDIWSFNSPKNESGINNIWEATETYCMSATHLSKNFGPLYSILQNPPYGLRREIIPILLLAVLLKHNDDMSFYMDGTFLPSIGAEHFEILVKNPDRFAVKYFEISGLRAQIFRELDGVFSNHHIQNNINTRNSKLLNIVKPLIKFVTKLPKSTLNSNNLSSNSKAIRKVLLEAREPDELLFIDLPQALGLSPIISAKKGDSNPVKIFKLKLIQALRELQTAYDNLLGQCTSLLYKAFSVRSDQNKLREDLRVRANYLVGQCIDPILRRFILSAADDTSDDKVWLEALLMIVADKPADCWKDEDTLFFESKLNEMARKFSNLEALQKDMVRHPGDGFIARRITVTHPDGTEINRMVWVDRDHQQKVDGFAQKILEDDSISNNEQLQLSLITSLIEKVTSQKQRTATSILPLIKKERKIV